MSHNSGISVGHSGLPDGLPVDGNLTLIIGGIAAFVIVMLLLKFKGGESHSYGSSLGLKDSLKKYGIYLLILVAIFLGIRFLVMNG